MTWNTYYESDLLKQVKCQCINILFSTASHLHGRNKLKWCAGLVTFPSQQAKYSRDAMKTVRNPLQWQVLQWKALPFNYIYIHIFILLFIPIFRERKRILKIFVNFRNAVLSARYNDNTTSYWLKTVQNPGSVWSCQERPLHKRDTTARRINSKSRTSTQLTQVSQ